MSLTDRLEATAPSELSKARAIAHRGVQAITAAARANLPAEADDSHSNLGWDPATKSFVCRTLTNARPEISLGYSLETQNLSVRRQGEIDDESEAFADPTAASRWLDAHLDVRKFKPSSVATIPYELPSAVQTAASSQSQADRKALDTLAAWYELASEICEGLAARNASIQPGPSEVRCWPHHFDIATYVSLEEGDAETAAGIGVGLSPGDETYDEPYFYVNPWPYPSSDALPAPIAPGHWHREGFVGAIATASELIASGSPETSAASFVTLAFDACRKVLGR